MTAYGMTITTDLSLDEADAAIREALAVEGFGILTEIDVAATLKAKLDVDRAPYRILGACNPNLAHRALEFDEQVGLLLPCNVIVAEGAGGTVVSVVDPQQMLGIAGSSPELDALATDARDRLARALDTLPKSD